jgi:DNA-binding transcriptional LysR family regulator
MPSDFANLLLADMLAAFVALHPGIALELDLSPRRVDLLGEGFDLAVRMGALPDDGLLAARRTAGVHQRLRKTCCNTTHCVCPAAPATPPSPVIGCWCRASIAGKAHRPAA